MAVAGFLCRYVCGPCEHRQNGGYIALDMLYPRHITINKNVLSPSLNKTFPPCSNSFVKQEVAGAMLTSYSVRTIPPVIQPHRNTA